MYKPDHKQPCKNYSYSSGSSENNIIVSNSSDPEQVPRLQGPIWAQAVFIRHKVWIFPAFFVNVFFT